MSHKHDDRAPNVHRTSTERAECTPNNRASRRLTTEREPNAYRAYIDHRANAYRLFDRRRILSNSANQTAADERRTITPSVYRVNTDRSPIEPNKERSSTDHLNFVSVYDRYSIAGAVWPGLNIGWCCYTIHSASPLPIQARFPSAILQRDLVNGVGKLGEIALR
jgi:hypothetical protein